WERKGADGKGVGGGVFTGSFESPAHARLPPEAQMCRFAFVSPQSESGQPLVWPCSPEEGGEGGAGESRPTAIVLLLPSTGEQGKQGRLALASKLAREHGYCSLVITAPWYAARKPASQQMHYIQTVESFLEQSTIIIQVRHVVVLVAAAAVLLEEVRGYVEV
ncbi:MAG: hypothetical protein SGPRY_010074, partial [Prymnesium sp.]